jgi:hypothetical protein
MFRVQYRWLGNEASVVFNTTVDAGGDRAGIRWVENRSATGDGGWGLHQDGTYAPADGAERWMGSIAQDKDGNIALGYSVTSASLFPSVRYTSRMAGDPVGTLPGGEVSCHEGTGAQTASSNRWGDYSSMSVDPVNDCTFWYTQEYYETTGSFDFSTRICSFTFPSCLGIVGCGDGICAGAPDEDCVSCPQDCPSGSTSGAVCGNGICEAADGEDCLTCAAECNGTQNGRPANRFCCGFGGQNPVGCSDSRCVTGGFQCTETPAGTDTFCCGDLECDASGLECETCGVDCSATDPICEDPGGCIPTSSKEKGPRCFDGIDNDCDGLIDGDDPDC